MAYCIYLRKSRADRELELQGFGETLKRHRDTLIELAKRKICQLVKSMKRLFPVTALPQDLKCRDYSMMYLMGNGRCSCYGNRASCPW